MRVTDLLERERPDMILPAKPSLKCGGFVGVADLTDCVTNHESEWFFGPYGFVLCNQREIPFMPARGELNFFDVKNEVVIAIFMLCKIEEEEKKIPGGGDGENI